MPELPREIEIMRVMNLVQGFGWAKVKEEFVLNKVVLTIEKELLPLESVQETAPPT